VVSPLQEAVFIVETRGKLYVHGMHPGRPETDRVSSCLDRSTDELQDVVVETARRRVASEIVRRLAFNGTNSKLEVAAVSCGQLDDDRDQLTRTISTNYDDVRCVATSQLVVARLRRVPCVATNSAFTAVNFPLSLTITATSFTL